MSPVKGGRAIYARLPTLVLCFLLCSLITEVNLTHAKKTTFYEDFSDISDWKRYGGWWGSKGLIELSKDVYVSSPSSLHIKSSISEATYIFRKVPEIDFKKPYTVIVWVYIKEYSDGIKVYSDPNVAISVFNNTLVILEELPKTLRKISPLEYRTWYEITAKVDPVSKVATVTVGNVTVTSSIPEEGIPTSNPYASWDVNIGDVSHRSGKGDVYIDDLRIIQEVPVEEGVLEVLVKDLDTGEPIPNATVTVNGLTGKTNSTGGLTVSLKAGTYTVSISALGYYSASERVTVRAGEKTIFELRLRPLFDFKLSVEPSSVKMKQGETKEVTIKVELVRGIARLVELYVTGLPEKASYTISPQKVIPPAQVKLTIKAGAAKGKFKVTIKGVSYGKVRTTTLDLTIEEKRCIIATVTYNSELSEVVDFLREFRDNIVLSTYAGRRFYAAFDPFYYSWSPSVAQAIHENPWLKPAFRVLLYPLILSLRVAALIAQPLVPINAEVAVFLAGTVTSVFIGLIYLSPLVYLLFHRRKVVVRTRMLVLIIAITLLISLMAEILELDLLLTITTSMYVLLLIGLGAIVPIRFSGAMKESRD